MYSTSLVNRGIVSLCNTTLISTRMPLRAAWCRPATV